MYEVTCRKENRKFVLEIWLKGTQRCKILNNSSLRIVYRLRLYLCEETNWWHQDLSNINRLWQKKNTICQIREGVDCLEEWQLFQLNTFTKVIQKNRLKLVVFRRWTNSKGSGEAESLEQTSLFHCNELMQYFYLQRIFLIHIFWETEDCSYSRSDFLF